MTENPFSYFSRLIKNFSKRVGGKIRSTLYGEAMEGMSYLWVIMGRYELL